MPGRQTPSDRPRRVGPAALLSLRTISGKLIVGLLVLFGLASVIVSVITAQSLNNSLMSSLNQQLVSATHTWATCVQQSAHDGQHNDADQNDAYRIDTDDYGVCNESEQAPGTLEAVLAGSSTGYKHVVQQACPLSATDAAMLAKLPLGAPLGTAPPADSSGSSRRSPRRARRRCRPTR